MTLVDNTENNSEVNLEDLTEESEEEKEELEKVDTNTLPYYIKVNYGAQVVNVYTKDSNGNYTVPFKVFVCSTGSATPTSGVYKIPNRFRWLCMKGTCYGQYVTQITGNILFHSVPYLRKDKASLEYWAYDRLGTYASAGCIRLTVADALWIFNNCPTGTSVEFYSSSNPGPLGKPSARKISNVPEPYRNWDPTDPDPSNPWKHYNGETIQTETPKQEEKKEDEQPKQEEPKKEEKPKNNTVTNTTTNTNTNTNTNTSSNSNTTKNNTTNTNTNSSKNTTNTNTNTNTKKNSSTTNTHSNSVSSNTI